jgi:DNA helicase-2/ATP-dependent DNA helicase PcrA
MSYLLEQLNDKQAEAVLQTEGPVLILAGAGSGKTRALTFRVAFLIKEKKIHPKNILAVTFTNKAAGEMLHRIKELLGLPINIPPYSAYLPHIGTFHSICVKILRQEIEKIGYDKNFIIYDETDQLALMKRVMGSLGISQDQIKPKAILNAISSSKNGLVDAENFSAKADEYFQDMVAQCYRKYSMELKKASAVDFDDLILLVVKIFKKYPSILEKYQNIFKYIMVDEYQDTNHAQYILLK